MAPTLRKEEVAQRLYTRGYFRGIDEIHREFPQIDVAKLSALKRDCFNHVLQKVLEAKTEVERLQKAVDRMEAVCRRGASRTHTEPPQEHSGLVEQLRQELDAVDGWTISLLETDFSLLLAVRNPETAVMRIEGLRDSFRDLWDLRSETMAAFENIPEVFNMGVR